jgi:predicted rRNA methylase YqxC with S4 and FtsJ domains
MTEQIIAFIATWGPSIAAIISIIAAVVKMAKDNRNVIKPVLEQFEQLREDVSDKTDLTEARQEMRVIIQQNAELRAQNLALMTALTKVQQYDKQV